MRKKKGGIEGSQACLPRILQPVLAGIVLALAACGDLSLVDSLQQEAPGDLRLTPATAAILLDTSFTLTVMGGITPYSLMSGAVTPLGENTWEFPAQPSISGEWEDFPIQISDWAGNTATAVVRVYGGPALNVTEVTLPEGIGWTFTVSGGAPPYSWNVDGVLKTTGTSYLFVSAVQGTYVVDVVDSLSFFQVAIVTVVPDTVGIDPLSITPTSAVVLPGGIVAFTALGGSGGYTFSAPDGGTFENVNANPATYTAPMATGPNRIDLTDSLGDAVSADVVVTATGTLPVLFPGSRTVTAIDEVVQFSAMGGSPPYAFSVNKPAIGSIDLVTGLYQQLDAGNVVVTVTDADGLTDNTLVKWKP